MKKTMVVGLCMSFMLHGSEIEKKPLEEDSAVQQKSPFSRGSLRNSFRKPFEKNKNSSEEVLMPRTYEERLGAGEFSENYLDDAGKFVVGVLGSQYLLAPFIKEFGAPAKLLILSAAGAGVVYTLHSKKYKEDFKSAGRNAFIATAAMRNVTSSNSLTTVAATGALAWSLGQFF